MVLLSRRAQKIYQGVSVERRKGILLKLFAVAILASIYVIAGKVGLALTVVNPSVSSVWAPAGIAVGALLVFGYRFWPVIFLGAFLVNVTSGSVFTSLVIAIGNSLEGVTGAYLINRFAGGRRVFER